MPAHSWMESTLGLSVEDDGGHTLLKNKTQRRFIIETCAVSLQDGPQLSPASLYS